MKRSRHAHPTERDEPLHEAPRPSPTLCRFCYQTAYRCAQVETRDPATWRVLHARDAVEAARRKKLSDERATTEMLVSLRRAARYHHH